MLNDSSIYNLSGNCMPNFSGVSALPEAHIEHHHIVHWHYKIRLPHQFINLHLITLLCTGMELINETNVSSRGWWIFKKEVLHIRVKGEIHKINQFMDIIEELCRNDY